MKKMKTLASLVLAIVLAFALTIPAFAATTPASIEITNASKGATYTAYKLFDAVVNEEGGITYTGTIPADKYSVTIGTGETAVTEEHSLTEFFETKANGQIGMVGDAKELNANAIATLKAWAQAQSNGTSATAQGGPLSLNVGSYGYYVVTSTIDSGAAITVTSTNPTATVVDKNSAGTPSFEGEGKTANGTSFDIGSTVTYTVSFKTVNWVGAGDNATKVTEYVLTDTATSNYLKNVQVTSIMIGNINYKDGNEVPQFGADMKITLPWVNANGDSLYDNGVTVTITYTATVAGKGAGTNKVTLTYNDTNVPTEPEVTIYNTDIVIDKYTMVDGTNTKLAGADFVLKNSENKFYKYTAASNDNTAKVEWVDNQSDATVKTTDSNGAATFEGLKAGDYTLVETEAPDGYNKLAEGISVKIVENKNDQNKVIGLKVQMQKNEGEELVWTPVEVVDVLNETGATLPSTGGMGTTLFYTIGGLLVVCSAILIVTKKRMNSMA